MRIAAVVLCVLILGCDATIPLADGRHGAPARRSWIKHLDAPGRVDISPKRVVASPALLLEIAGAPGAYDLAASIEGTSCESFDGKEPLIELRADDASVVRWVIAAGSPAPYHTRITLGVAPRRFEFAFSNCFATEDCERSVTVHSVELHKADE